MAPANLKQTVTNGTFAQRLLDWFDQAGRKDLPWQQDKTPYRIWVSEIMLQQTQVSSVIPYFLRFMASFPTLQSLAEADQDRVLQHWAGLGYYARARNLHQSAKIIQTEFQGIFPDQLADMVRLPGIGRSTAGAILSIAFKKHAVILDGNVKRVLCRYHAINSWPGEKATEDRLWQLAEQLTPRQRVDAYTQAIMDLGATLCRRSKPDCQLCPMAISCQAYQQDRQANLPVAKPKKALPLKHTWIAHIESEEGLLLLEKRVPSGIWGGLYSLPEFDANLPLQDLADHCSQRFGCRCQLVAQQDSFIHTFSHYKLELKPVLLHALTSPNRISDNDSCQWLKKSALKQLGLPSPIAKYLQKSVSLGTDQQRAVMPLAQSEMQLTESTQ